MADTFIVKWNNDFRIFIQKIFGLAALKHHDKFATVFNKYVIFVTEIQMNG